MDVGGTISQTVEKVGKAGRVLATVAMPSEPAKTEVEKHVQKASDLSMVMEASYFMDDVPIPFTEEDDTDMGNGLERSKQENSDSFYSLLMI